MAESTYNQATINNTLAKIEQQFGALQAEREANTVESRTAGLNASTEEAYRQRQLQGQQAQNQFAQNTMGNQMSALDAIRTSNASQIASGANAGLAAANQLSAILGLQESNNEAATNIANDAITAAAERNTAMAQNAVTAQSQVDQQNQSIREVEAQLQAVQAELAKASSQEEAARLSAEATALQAQISASAQRDSSLINQGVTGGTEGTTVGNPTGDGTVTPTTPVQTQAQQELVKQNNIATVDRTVQTLKNFNAGWATGDGQTFATSYWDPWQNKQVSTGANQNNQKGGTAKDMQRVAQRIETELNSALASGDQQRIDLWMNNATKFSTTMTTENDKCLVPGTLITMADGSTKKVEDVKAGDLLLVWNLQTGEAEASPCMFNDSKKSALIEVIQLKFSDGTLVEMVGDHGFFNVTLMKYVYIKTLFDARSYIRHNFLKSDGTQVYLVDLTTDIRYTATYSPCTYEHLCLYANGILSMPGATESFANIFKINPETFAYDPASMSEDIEAFGLFTPEDFQDLIPEQVFHAFQGQFLKVSISKGLTSMEEIAKLVERYGAFLTEM